MNRIKEVLEEKGIKQTELADKLGKSYKMVNGYVQNRKQPRLEILYEIARIKKYQFIYGHNNANKNILVIWRSVKDWSVEDFKADAATLKTELKAFEYDLLYINDQAHIEGYQPIEEVFKNKMLT